MAGKEDWTKGDSGWGGDDNGEMERWMAATFRAEDVIAEKKAKENKQHGSGGSGGGGGRAARGGDRGESKAQPKVGAAEGREADMSSTQRMASYS